MTEPAAPFTVTVHPFPSKTPNSCAFEHGESRPNALVFIGGLTDGPHTNTYVRYLSEHLAASGAANSASADNDDAFSVWEFRMRSSYTGFGYSSLANDAEDTAALVTYLRSLGKRKVVLMGCSTGCQGCMLYGAGRDEHGGPPVDGYILASPVSDRETAAMLMPREYLDATVAEAAEMIGRGKQGDAMPRELVPPIFSAPVTAYRWNSLAAKGGDDDYFSSDIDAEALSGTFGRIDAPVLIAPSGSDELVPPTVDKRALLGRWVEACPRASGESAVNPGADHAVSGEDARKWLSDRAVAFLESLP